MTGRRRTEAGDEAAVHALIDREVLFFGGKGGVGKTTCAAAIALALARRDAGQVLLLSTDPAHSLGDVLGVVAGDEVRAVPGAPRLLVRETDADRAFAERRQRYRHAVDELFTHLRGGSRFDPTFDRAVVRDLMDLAPPGLDELFGILAVIDALFPARSGVPSAAGVPASAGTPGAPGAAAVVVDMAPTGHALRLLALPEIALAWVHALLALLLRYRAVIGLGDLSMDLLALARDLRRLLALLRDPGRARVLAVTRAAELPRLETVRLVRGVRRLGLAVGAVVANALTPPACARCRRAAVRERRALAGLRAGGPSRRLPGYAMILAPSVAPPPRGVAELTRWWSAWALDDGMTA
jgi:arsenite-transporting ATPase